MSSGDLTNCLIFSTLFSFYYWLRWSLQALPVVKTMLASQCFINYLFITPCVFCSPQVYKSKTEAAKKEYLKALAAYRASLVSKVSFQYLFIRLFRFPFMISSIPLFTSMLTVFILRLNSSYLEVLNTFNSWDLQHSKIFIEGNKFTKLFL